MQVQVAAEVQLPQTYLKDPNDAVKLADELTSGGTKAKAAFSSSSGLPP